MGLSFASTAAIIGVSFILILQIFTTSLPPIISDVTEAYDRMKDRTVEQCQTDMNITSIVDIGWWDTSWANRKLIIINHSMVQEDQKDFPVLIYRSADAELAAQAKSNGDDILFISGDNSTQYNHEIENYDNTTGELTAWVKIPSLSSTQDTILLMYYGNPSSRNQENITGTWDGNYRMVQHLNESSGTLYDSTSYGNNGTNKGALYNASSKIDGGYDFNETDNINCGNNNSLDITNTLTLEAWVKDPPLGGLDEQTNTIDSIVKDDGVDDVERTTDYINILTRRVWDPSSFFYQWIASIANQDEGSSEYDNEQSQIHESVPQPHIYHTAPENSFGSSTIETVNWSYFWQVFDQQTGWDLEAYDSNNDTWVRIKQHLDILQNRSDDNRSEKIALSFTAPYSTDYRLTFIFDFPIVSYIDRSDDYEYILEYNVRKNDTYSVFFNWSDMIGIPSLVFYHGFKNIDGEDKFLFRVYKNNVTAGTNVLLDPTFGDTTTSATAISIEDTIRGGKFTMPENGKADNISAYLEAGPGAKNNVKFAIYDASDQSLVGYTGQAQGVDGWNTLDITFGGNLSSGKEYYLVAWAENTAKTMEIYYDAGTNPAALDSQVYNGFPNPWAETADGTKNYSIYCSYSLASPIITGEYPANSSTGISKKPICNVTVSDLQSDTMTVYFYENTTGVWKLQQTNTSVSSESNVVWNNYSNASSYSNKYWWSVNVSDGLFWTNETYSFTTKANVAPTITGEVPANQSTEISTWPVCNVTVSDTNGDEMTVYFYENTTGVWKLQQTNASVANNSKVVWLSYNNASDYLKKYWWSVNVTDEHDWTNETYYFKTTDVDKVIVSKEKTAYALKISLDGSRLHGIVNNTNVTAPIDTSWHYVVLSYDGTTLALYVDGELQNTTTMDGSIPINEQDVLLGERLTGTLDELRISNSARSDSWVETSYNMMNSPTTFIRVESEQNQQYTYLSITIKNTGSATIKITEFSIMVNGTGKPIIDLQPYLYPRKEANILVDVLAAGIKRNKLITGNCISDCEEYG